MKLYFENSIKYCFCLKIRIAKKHLSSAIEEIPCTHLDEWVDLEKNCNQGGCKEKCVKALQCPMCRGEPVYPVQRDSMYNCTLAITHSWIELYGLNFVYW